MENQYICLKDESYEEEYEEAYEEEYEEEYWEEFLIEKEEIVLYKPT